MSNERKIALAAALNSPVLAVANHIHREGATPLPWIVTFLQTIDAEFPELSFHEFFRAVRLCDLVNREASGSA